MIHAVVALQGSWEYAVAVRTVIAQMGIIDTVDTLWVEAGHAGAIKEADIECGIASSADGVVYVADVAVGT